MVERLIEAAPGAWIHTTKLICKPTTTRPEVTERVEEQADVP
jgi:hypothetical protein